MTARQLLERLRNLGVSLTVDGEQLKVSAPRGVLTEELRQNLVAQKADLLALLRQARAEVPIRRVGLDGALPLSFAQERLWFFEQLEPGTATFNIAAKLRATGPLDLVALAGALDALTERHDVLRMVFPAREGQPVAQFGMERPTIETVDFRGEADAVDRAERAVQTFCERPFDLDKGPLLRLIVAIVDDEDAFVAISIHHIVSDGWSLGIIGRDLRTAYEQVRAGVKPSLPALPVQYADYAVWQKEWLSSGVEDRQLAYWRRELAGVLPILELPSDRPRARELTYRAASVRAEIPAPLQAMLQRSSPSGGTTWYTVLLTAFYVLLARQTGETDLVVGSPVAGRVRRELEELVGVFINTLPIRVSVDLTASFDELLALVNTRVLEALNHQDLPFARLVNALQPERELAHTPVFQVLFNMLPAQRATEGNWADVRMAAAGIPVLGAKFDITMYAVDQAGRTSLELVYNRDLFLEGRMIDLLDQFVGLLEHAAARPGLPVGSYDLVTPRARPILPDPVRPLDAGRGGSLVQAAAITASTQGDSAAIVSSGGTWSYAHVAREAQRVATTLATAGVQRGDVVAVHARREAALVPALLGALQSGAAFLVLDPSYPSRRLAEMVRMGRPAARLQLSPVEEGSLEVEEAFSELPVKVRLTIGSGPRSAPGATGASTEDLSHPDAPAYAAFTSGTTGGLKMVLGSQRPVAHFLEWYTTAYALSSRDRFALLAGLAHDPLLRDVFAPLWVGATLCVPSSEVFIDPAALLAWLRAERVSVVHWTPTLSTLLTAGAAAGALPDLRLACFGGEPLTRRVAERVREIAPRARLVNFYGATETPQAMGAYDLPIADAGWTTLRDPLPVGTGIADVQLLVLNGTGQLCPPGELGEIVVRTPYLTQGYAAHDTPGTGRFEANPFTGRADDRVYRTGDLGRYRVDGVVEFAGRRDRQVKLRGFRIELGEVEAALEQLPAVREAAVLLEDAGTDRARLVAYCVTDLRGERLTDLRGRLREALPDYMVPAVFVPLDALPRTPNGKLDTRALEHEARCLSAAPVHGATDADDREPRDALEFRLFRVWESVLGVHNLSRYASFFDLGGNSLLAVQLFARIEQEFGRKFPLALLFQAPTLHDLAALLRRKEWAPTWRALVPVQPNGGRTPIFALPGIGGNVVNYHPLARVLGTDQPIYGLQARGFDGTPPFENIEALAAHHLSEIRAVQPRGPYRFVGLCIGGLIAYEMAQRLKQQGEDVDLIVMLDTFPSSPIRKLRGSKRVARVMSVGRLLANRAGLYWAVLRRTPILKWSDFIRRKITGIRERAQSTDAPSMGGAREDYFGALVERANLRAAGRYVPSTYSGDLVFFQASRRRIAFGLDNRPSWKRLVRHMTMHALPTIDSGTMLIEPHVRVVADEIIRQVALADEKRARSSPEVDPAGQANAPAVVMP